MKIESILACAKDVREKANLQKQFFLELERRLGVNKPIFVDRNLIEWKHVENQIGVGIWEVSEEKLVRAGDIQSENIIGRYKLTGDNSDCWELWFDVESNKGFGSVADVQDNWKKLQQATLQLLTALEWFGVPNEYINIKSSGRGLHVHVFTKGIRDDQQYKQVMEAIYIKTGLPNVKSRDYQQLDDVIFGIDKTPIMQTVRKVREYGGINDKLSGVFHYCSNIPIDKFSRLRKYPFVFDPRKVMYPTIVVYEVDKDFIRKVHEVATETITTSLKETGIVNYELEGNPADLYKCPLVRSLIEKAEKDHHLTNPERVFLSQLFPFFGEHGVHELHKIIGHCKDYDHDYTQYQIDSMKRNNRKPITCDWAKRYIGCPPECKGSGGKSSIKFAWSPISLDEVKERFCKWLSFVTPDGTEDTEVLDVLLATACDRMISGPPIWLFIVSPSGGTKTELLRSLSKWNIYSLDSLTRKTFISGLVYKDKETGELKPIKGILEDLDGKILVVKDFTLLLSKDRDERMEVFGQLRNVYDGYLEAAYGTMKEPIRVESSFGMVAGVTPIIDNYHTLIAVLGERYLKIRHYLDGRKAVEKALKNFGKEDQMRKELQQTVYRFLKNLEFYEVAVPKEIVDKIITLARFVALLRTPILTKQLYGLADFEISTEYATRLVKQLTKLLKLVAIVRGKTQADDTDFATIMRVAYDTVPHNRTKIVRFLYQHGNATTDEIAEYMNLSMYVAKKRLEAMQNIGIVKHDEDFWMLQDDCVAFMDKLHHKGKVGKGVQLNL